jgi:hypothetical protein
MPLDKIPESEFPEELLPQPVRHKADDLLLVVDIPYEELPDVVKHNLTPSQWEEAQYEVIPQGGVTPDTTEYLNLKNGQFKNYKAGEHACAPLLAAHNLSGGRGADSTQFHSAPSHPSGSMEADNP